MSTLVERFHSKYRTNPDTGCWDWIGGLDRDGYGQLGEGKYKKHKAHRLSYQLFIGKLGKGDCVCHRCDNPSCVNPMHLWKGTQAENMKDRQRKGRTPRGEKQGSCKLTPSQIKDIRLDARPQSKIAKDFGVSQSQISRIKTGKHWGWHEN